MKHKILSTLLMSLNINPKDLISGKNYAQLLYTNRLIENYIIESLFFKDRADDKYIVEVKYPIEDEKVKTYHDEFTQKCSKILRSHGEITENEIEYSNNFALVLARITQEDVNKAIKGKEKEIEDYISYQYIKYTKNIISQELNTNANEIIKKYRNHILSQFQVFGNTDDNKNHLLKNYISKITDEEGLELNNIVRAENGLVIINPCFNYDLATRVGTGRQLIKANFQPNLVHVDEVNKKIEILYLKVCSDIFKYHSEFKEDILYYEIGLQELVLKQILKDKEFKNYSCNTSVMCIDSNNLYVFNIKDLTLKNCKINVESLIDDYFFHTLTKKYNMPKKYLNNEVYL